MLTGENGILSQAQKADVETRGAAVEEAKNLWETNKTLDENTGENTAESLEELLNRLVDESLLTEDEKDLILGNEEKGIEATGEVTIGSRTIVFGIEGPTIGSKYDEGAIKIGDKITYSANGQNNWIVFGKDESGNVLLTTEKPIDNAFELCGSAEKWLTYEDDLNNACSIYGSKVQGKTVTSRSITMEDINYVAGFTEPDFSNYTYTFGSEDNYNNKKVKYYYPSEDAASTDYWQDPNKQETTFEANDYSYYWNWDDDKYYYYGPDTDYDEVELIEGQINKERFKYIVGGKDDDAYSDYVVASRSVLVDSGNASFRVAVVRYGYVNSDTWPLCSGFAGERV